MSLQIFPVGMMQGSSLVVTQRRIAKHLFETLDQGIAGLDFARPCNPAQSFDIACVKHQDSGERGAGFVELSHFGLDFGQSHLRAQEAR